MYYQCIKHRSLGCKGSAVVESNMIVGVQNEHNHDNDLLATKIRAQEKEAICRGCCNEHGLIRKLYWET